MKHFFLHAIGLLALLLLTRPLAAATPELQAIILGSGSPQYNEQRAGPSVLIRYGDTSLLVDTGNGTQARLAAEQIAISSIDGLLYTHHHLDHNEEFVPVFIRALLGGNPLQLIGPVGTTLLSDSTLILYEQDIRYRMRRSERTLEDSKAALNVRDLEGGEHFNLGGIEITTAAVNHSIATVAYRFEAGGHSIVISGDLSYSASLSALAKDADVLIIDSGGTQMVEGTRRGAGGARRNQTTRRGDRDVSTTGRRSGQRGERAHVTLEESARMASEAGVKTLLLTHFASGTVDEAATRAELAEGFAGAVEFATDGLRVTPNPD